MRLHGTTIRISVVAALLGGLLAMPQAASAAGAVRCVGAVPSGCTTYHATIEAAAAAAGPGDTILVGPGVYPLARVQLGGHAGLVFRSTSGPGQTKLQSVPGTQMMLESHSPDVLIEGFGFEQTDSESHHGLTISGARTRVRNNTFTDLTIAIAVGGSNSNIDISSNRFEGGGSAVYAVGNSGGARVRDNHIDSAAVGVNMPEGGNAGYRIAGNRFIDNTRGVRLHPGDLGGHQLRHNCFDGNTSGAVVNDPANPAVDAANNHFGAFDGPAGAGGSGDAVSGPVNVAPIATECELDWDELAGPIRPGNHAAAGAPTVLKIGGFYHMWYSATLEEPLPDGTTRKIGHTTSTDGRTWSAPDVVNFTGPGCEAPPESCGFRTMPSAVLVGNTIRLYTWGYRSDWAEPGHPFGKSQWVSESTDGVNFTDLGQLEWSDPPVVPGDPRQIDFSVTVLPTASGWEGYFERNRGDIYRAETSDPSGRTGWTNPVLVRDAIADCSDSCTRAHVVKDNGLYRMFVGYGLGGPNEFRPHIGMATSTDGVSFSPLGRVLSVEDGVAWRAWRTYHPWVAAVGTDLLMWFGARATSATDDRVAIGHAKLDRDTFVEIDAVTDPITQANVTAVQAVGRTEPGATVSAVVTNGTSTSPVRTVVAVTDGSFTISGLNATALPDGAASVRVTAADGAGHARTATLGTTKSVAGPAIGAIDVSNPRFSPNGDGTKDTTTVTANVPGATSWTVRFSSGGSTLATRTGSSPAVSAVWDGRPDAGGSAVEATYSISLTASDSSGNSSVGGASATVDLTPPAVKVTSPLAGSATRDTTPDVSGTAGTAAGDGSQVTIEVSSGGTAVGPPALLTASDGAFAGTVGPLADGAYQVTAAQSDAAGNTGVSSRSFTVDTTPPAVQITKVTAPINDTTAPSVEVTGTAEVGTTVSVELAIAGERSAAVGAPVKIDGGFVSAGIDARPLPAGSGVAIATARDAAGNSRMATFPIEKVARPNPPTVRIADGGDGYVGAPDSPENLGVRVTHNGPQPSGTVSATLRTAGGAVHPLGSVVLSRGRTHTFRFNLVAAGAPNGLLVATASIEDVSASTTSILDRTPPTTTIASPRGAYFATPPLDTGEFSGSASDSLSGIVFVKVTLTSPSGGPFVRFAQLTQQPSGVTWRIDFASFGTALPTGTYTVTAQATDGAGNTDQPGATATTFVVGR